MCAHLAVPSWGQSEHCTRSPGVSKPALLWDVPWGDGGLGREMPGRTPRCGTVMSMGAGMPHNHAWDKGHAGKWAGGGSVEKVGWDGSVEVIFSMLSLWVPISSPPRQQDDAVEWLLPLLPRHQRLLPRRHCLGHHYLHLPLCLGHFHHHLAGDPGQGGKWRDKGAQASGPCPVHPTSPLSQPQKQTWGANVPTGLWPGLWDI